MKFLLLLFLAVVHTAWADDNVSSRRSGSQTFSPDRGGTTVEDWRLIMPYWDQPANPTPSNWSASFYMEYDYAPQGAGWIGVPAGSSYIQNNVEVDYKLGKDTQIFVRPTWNTAYAPADSKTTVIVSPGRTAVKMGDTVIGLTQKNIFTWDGGGSFNGFARYYAPTAEADRTTGQIGEAFLRANFDQPINSWLRLWFDTKGWWAFQSQSVYVDPNDATEYKRTYDKELLPYFTAVVSLAKHWKFFQSAGVDYTWMNGIYETDAPTPAEFTAMYFDTSIGTDLIDHVDLRLGISDTPSVGGATDPALLQPGEYYYYLWFVISI